MANGDRKLTLEEVLNGNITKDFLDKKEKIAIIKRHIKRLSDKRFDIEDKIEVIGENKELLEEHKKLSDKISKLQNELKSIT